MSFKEGDKVKVISKSAMHSQHEGRIGTVLRVFEDGQTVNVELEWDAPASSMFDKMGCLTGFFVSELELFDPKREALITLAETLDSARKQANAVNGCDGAIYQSITTPLISVLDALVPVDATGYDAYEFIIIEDGRSVREALKALGK